MRIWTYEQDLKSTYAPIVIAIEDGRTTTQSYYSQKPISEG